MLYTYASISSVQEQDVEGFDVFDAIYPVRTKYIVGRCRRVDLRLFACGYLGIVSDLDFADLE